MGKLNEYIEFLEMAETDPQLLVWLLELRRHRENNWQQRAEAAEADNRNYSELLSYHIDRQTKAEAKLADLEKQEPYGYVHNLVNPPLGSGVAASIFKKENRHYGRPVFTRPAPAINLAELVPDEKATLAEAGGYGSIISLEQKSLFVDGGKWVRSAMLRNIEEAK